MMRATAMAALLIPAPGPAGAAEIVSGPVRAEVVRVVDGDTVAVQAHPWLGMTIETDIRLEGIDTPEHGGRAKCATEAILAERASAVTRAMLAPGLVVQIMDIRQDKYGGRVVGRIVLADGRDLSTLLISAGLAHPYDGGTKSSWCP